MNCVEGVVIVFSGCDVWGGLMFFVTVYFTRHQKHLVTFKHGKDFISNLSNFTSLTWMFTSVFELQIRVVKHFCFNHITKWSKNKKLLTVKLLISPDKMSVENISNIIFLLNKIWTKWIQGWTFLCSAPKCPAAALLRAWVYEAKLRINWRWSQRSSLWSSTTLSLSVNIQLSDTHLNN